MTNVLSFPSRTPLGAAAAVARAAGQATAIPLEEVVVRAELQSRLDRKYVVTAGDFLALSARLAGDLDVLEIDGRRSSAYESQYFDTPSLLTYHDGLEARSDRFKVRTRSYLDTRETMFEVKLEAPGGGTVKRRVAHPFRDRGRITPRARRLIGAALLGAGRPVPRGLAPTCVTAYRRTTFVARDGSTRVTCDHDLVCFDGDRVARALDNQVVVEVKSAAAATPVDQALLAVGATPVSISKYCLGLALLQPELPAGRWAALLERRFDRAPLVAAA